MMKYICQLVVILTFSLPMNSNAQSEGEAFVNLINDYAECYSFWEISKMGAPDADKKYIDSIEKNQIYILNVVTSLQGELGIKEESFLASVKNMMAMQMKSIDRDMANFSILSNKYIDFCLNLRKNPEQRLEYWLNE